MINGLLGKKVGMTQLLQDDGTVVPVTVIQAGPCVVVQKKTKQTDGYDAVQLGLVEFIKPRFHPYLGLSAIQIASLVGAVPCAQQIRAMSQTRAREGVAHEPTLVARG